jgi:hypothetical protein
MITLEELEEQKIIIFLFNESEDPSSNNEMIEISIKMNINHSLYSSINIQIC